jgi:hypothetical protein
MARGRAGLDPIQAGFRARIMGILEKCRCLRFQGGGVNLKTVLTWAAVAFAIWWVIQQPDSAAHLVHNIGSLLTTAANGISHFIATI